MKIAVMLTTFMFLSGCANFTGNASDDPVRPENEGRTMGQVIDDNNLATRLAVNLDIADERFGRTRVEIHVNHGVVLFLGQVPDAAMITRATQVAKDDNQVVAVHNHLTVGEPLSAGIRTNDSWLAVKIKSRMFTTDDFSSSDVSIVVEKGVVYLLGKVAPDTAKMAVQIASEVSGVQKIVTVFTPAE